VRPRKKAPSRSRNASQHRPSSSKAARSARSAVKKSKQLKSELQIATPQNYPSLAQAGIIVPDDLDPENETVNLDFTAISSRIVGAILSRFAVRYAHAIYVLATRRAELLAVKRRVRFAESQWRVRHGQDFKTKYEADDEMMEDKSIRKLESERVELEAEIELLGAVCDGFMAIRDAASREIERRKYEQAQT
jgi:hypothetical protein